MPSSKHFIHIISFNPHKSMWNYGYYQFTDEETRRLNYLLNFHS